MDVQAAACRVGAAQPIPRQGCRRAMGLRGITGQPWVRELRSEEGVRAGSLGSRRERGRHRPGFSPERLELVFPEPGLLYIALCKVLGQCPFRFFHFPVTNAVRPAEGWKGIYWLT